jgi:phosphoenolpyruvate-protein phosphotransferase
MTKRTLHGRAAAPGIAIGPVVVVRPERPSDTPAGPPDSELARLDAAIAAADAATAQLETRLLADGKVEEAEIFTAHRMLLADPGLRDRAAELIAADQRSAGAAIGAAAEEQAVELLALGDEYLAARAADVRDVAAQVQRALSGAQSLGERLQAPAIVFAHDLGPSDLAGVPAATLLGFALAAGGLTAHTTILARALGVPAVVGVGDELLTAVEDGAPVALDGGTGAVELAPDPARLADLRAAQSAQAAEREARRAEVTLPAVTRDGHTILLVANASTPAEARAAHEWGAQGVGLLRTELLFLDRPDLPGEEEQLALYRAVAAELPGTPITVRTLDIGGDKYLPAFPLPKEDNPFLGWRGLRIGLSRPEILLPQLRALLRAGAEADIRIMLPMVSTLDELRRARALLNTARTELTATGVAHAVHPQLGIMVEVPAAALNAEALAREADFFSIGTNDLTQYTLACDRTNSRVAELYQPLDPAVLRLISLTCAAAQRYGRHVAVCGELGGDPLATALLIGLGVNELSCAPTALANVRRAVRATDVRAARALAEAALACNSPTEVAALLQPP